MTGRPAAQGERQVQVYREGEAPAEPAQRELRPPAPVRMVTSCFPII